MAKKRPAEDQLVRPPPPEAGRCQFFVEKKRKYCPLSVKPEQSLCVNHRSDDERVPCPYDGNHGVLKKQLKKHMQICTSRPSPSPSYYSLDINGGDAADDQAPATRDTLAAFSPAEFSAFCERVRRAFESVEDDLPPDAMQKSPSFDEKLQKFGSGKHALQQASLLSHMESRGMLSRTNINLEFGCGRAEFSSFLHKEIGDPSHFILIDRAALRLKVGRTKTPKDTVWEKIQIDIKDLDLNNLLVDPSPATSGVLAYSKHLCGVATDLTLRCLMARTSTLPPLVGIAIALCCHQRCRRRAYINNSFLEHVGLLPDDFALLSVISSWAVCGRRPKSNGTPADGNVVHDDEGHEIEYVDCSDEGKSTHFSGLAVAEREMMGMMAKRILDVGRVRYLRSHGFDAQLIRYVDANVSLENVAILATPPIKKTS